MGADQSFPQGAQLKSQRDEDLPYTSLSINKPIDGDTPRSSPRLMSKTKAGHSTQRDRSQDGESSGTAPTSKKHEIIVVKEAQNPSTELDPELQKLENIPMFLPVMKTTLNIPILNESDPDEKLDMCPVLKLCTRYQEHLHQCAEAVNFDQNALCVRIKEVDFAVGSLYTKMSERQKKFAKYADQIQKVQEMNSILHKVRANLEQTLPLMERLNSVLPPEEQLETFSMSKTVVPSTSSNTGGASKT